MEITIALIMKQIIIAVVVSIILASIYALFALAISSYTYLQVNYPEVE